jgi:large subunit ribosomal protein L21
MNYLEVENRKYAPMHRKKSQEYPYLQNKNGLPLTGISCFLIMLFSSPKRLLRRMSLHWFLQFLGGQMYAIIETGGKQFRVEKGDVIDVELLASDTSGKVEFKNVLLINSGKAVKIGTPHIANSAVKGELLQEVRGPKVIAFKYKKRKHIRRKVGHRQHYSRVKITDIIG